MTDLTRRTLVLGAPAGGLAAAAPAAAGRAPIAAAAPDLRTALAAPGALGSVVNPRPAGVAGDGTTSDRAAFLAQRSGIVVPRGTYYFDDDAVIDVSVHGLPGMLFRIAAGKTLVFRGGFDGAVERLFAGPGAVDLTRAGLRGRYASAEWWGIVAGDAAAAVRVANTALVRTAIAACPLLEFQARDYHFADTVILSGQRVKVRGAGIHSQGDLGGATRFLIENDTAHGVILGFAEPPRTAGGHLDTAALAADCRFEDIEVSPGAGIAPSKAGGSVGVMVQYAQDALVRRVKSQQFMTSFAWAGTINTVIEDSRAYRTLAGTGAGADFYHAYAEITAPTPVSEINGNASTYLVGRNITAASANIPDSTGLALDGRFADTFVDQFETAGLKTGVDIRGDRPGGDAAVDGGGHPLRANSNCTFGRLVLDQCATACIRIAGIDRNSTIGFSDTYCAPAPGAVAAVHITDSAGPITFGGGKGEYAMIVAPGARAFLVTGSRKVTIERSQKIMECGFRAIDAADVADCTLEAEISNEVVPLGDAVLVSGTGTGNEIRPRVSGAAGKVAAAVRFATATHRRTTVDVSAIDPACVGDGRGAGRLVWHDGTADRQITAEGYFGAEPGGGGTNKALGNFG